MAQSTYCIRMDDKLKRTFDSLCENFGMTATVAFNIFAREVVREKRIPFIIRSDDDKMYKDAKIAFESLRKEAKKNNVQGMSLKEINSIIDKARESK